MSHIPGPWRQGGTKEFSPIGKCREIVADAGRIGLVYGTTDEDCKANARLIALAPELLDACKLAIQACRENLRAYQYKDEIILHAAMLDCERLVKLASAATTEIARGK
jgi:enoyl-CoA hydratase/carnithine racemase